MPLCQRMQREVTVAQMQLEGHAVQVSDERDKELRRLRDEVESLRDQLDIANRQIESAKRESSRRVAAIRDILSPVFNGMRVLFGELDQIPADSAPQSTPAQPSSNGGYSDKKAEVWNLWKQKLGNACSRIIDALLAHGTLSRQQICIVTGITSNNLSGPLDKMRKAAILELNGGAYSLKQI